MTVGAEESPSSPQGAVSFGPPNRNSGLPGGDLTMNSRGNMLALPAPGSDTQDHSVSLTPKDENGHRYVGLVNQAMTCYLNSLLQTLYMTPEFRNAIYEWEYNKKSGNEENSIPCQLQKLFLLLQSSENSSLETKDLTTSFGWSNNEAYDQHDVQELCRLMFDALECRWKKTPHEKLIERLYRGTMEDFVKCLQCGKENVRQDVFLDLPLAVKQFGALEAFKSVEEALAAFVCPELLDGANQYMCEQCKSKQNAHKGLRITQFPYLLTIQLKRFDFDYTTFNRIKLNDRMSFPDLLDLNGFVHKSKKEDAELSEPKKEEGEGELPMEEDSIKNDQASDEGVDMEEGESSSNQHTLNKKVRVGWSLEEDEVSSRLKTGPAVYELFSVMVHQGNAAGGHYFAYIKNMELGKWLCFNDTRVEMATPEEIEKSFGGVSGGWTNSNTNAYMLMYRQVDPSKNRKFIRTAELPPHIANLKARWKQMEEEKEEKRKYELSLLKINVRLNTIGLPLELVEKTKLELSIPRTQQLYDIYEKAYAHFQALFSGLKQPHPSKQNTRLIRCASSTYCMQEAYNSPQDRKKTIESTISHNHSRYHELYFLFDNKGASPCFNYVPVGEAQTCEIRLVDVTKGVIGQPFLFPIDPAKDTVKLVKNKLAALLRENMKEGDKYRIVVEKRTDDRFELLDKADVPIAPFLSGSGCATHIFVDGGAAGPVVTEDREREPMESRLFKLLDRNKFGMQLKFALPSEEDVSSHIALGLSPVAESPPVTESESPSSAERVERGEEEMTDKLSTYSTHSDDGVDLSSGSMCNNTPQMSPNVSENGEFGVGDEYPVGSPMSVQDVASGIEARFPLTETTNDWVSDEAGLGMATSSISQATVVPADGSGKVSTASHEHDVVVVAEVGNILSLNVDSRSSVGQLRAWLARRLSVDPATFSFVVCYDEEEKMTFESSAKDTDEVKSAWGTVKKVIVKLRPALREDEKMMKVVQFDTEEMDKEKWRQLFELPVSKETRFSEVLARCVRVYEDKYQKRLRPEQIHLRCCKTKKVEMWGEEKMGERGNNWNETIFMHIIPEDRLTPEVVNSHHVAVFVRRFRPSTVELDAIDYVLVEAGVSGQWSSFRSVLSAHSRIPLERLELADTVSNDWDKWPYPRSRIELLETVCWRQSFFGYGENLFFTKVGHRVLYYRDKEETAKQLSEEDRKTIRIKDQGQAALVRRKERPLRIQMSSISEA